MRHVGLGTESQFKGAVFGTVVGGVIGALVGLAIGWFLLSDLDTSVRVILLMVLGAPAGAGGQFASWGGRTPELRSEERRVGKVCVSPCISRWSPHSKQQHTISPTLSIV